MHRLALSRSADPFQALASRVMVGLAASLITLCIEIVLFAPLSQHLQTIFLLSPSARRSALNTKAVGSSVQKSVHSWSEVDSRKVYTYREGSTYPAQEWRNCTLVAHKQLDVLNMFHKNGISLFIRANSTLFYSILYCNLRALHIRLKYVFLVNSVIVY